MTIFVEVLYSATFSNIRAGFGEVFPLAYSSHFQVSDLGPKGPFVIYCADFYFPFTF